MLAGIALSASAQVVDTPTPMGSTYTPTFHLLNLHVGGGFGVPLNPTASFAGLSGSFQVGGGYNLSTHNSLVGEFMWSGLPPNRNSLVKLLNPAVRSINATNNLYALTANYMYHREGQRFGYY